jgi:hypothetical protein
VTRANVMCQTNKNWLSAKKSRLSFILYLVCCGCFRVGGGGSDQVLPSVIEPGRPAEIRLELSVWGEGGSIKGRYSNIELHYRIVGDVDYKQLYPQLLSSTSDREVYIFTLPPFPAGTTGYVEFYFELKLNGVQNHIPGVRKIPFR